MHRHVRHNERSRAPGGAGDAHVRRYRVEMSRATDVVDDFYERMHESGFECCLSFSCRSGRHCGPQEATIASAIRTYLATPLTGIAEDPGVGSGSADINASVLRGLGPEQRGKNDLDMRKIATCFHLPIDTAAKALGIGSTAIKRICRKHGLDRWPHRKLKCIERTISNLKKKGSDKGSDAGDLQKKIERLDEERQQFMGFFSTSC